MIRLVLYLGRRYIIVNKDALLCLASLCGVCLKYFESNNLIFLGKDLGQKSRFSFVAEASNTAGFDFRENVAIKFCNYVFTYC